MSNPAVLQSDSKTISHIYAAAQGEAPSQHFPQVRGKEVGPGSLDVSAILRDQPADGHARETIEQGQHGLPNGAPDILEIHVDAFWAGRGKLLRKVRRAMVDRGVEA